MLPVLCGRSRCSLLLQCFYGNMSVSHDGSAECVCQPGWEGERCSVSKHAQCHHGVFDSTNTYCRCDPMWAGEVSVMSTDSDLLLLHALCWCKCVCMRWCVLLLGCGCACRRATSSLACTAACSIQAWTAQGRRRSHVFAKRTGRAQSKLLCLCHRIMVTVASTGVCFCLIRLLCSVACLRSDV